MKRTLSIVVAAFATSILAASMTLASSARAEDTHHPEQKTDVASAKVPAKVSGPASSEAIRKMQGNVKKMRSELDRIAKAKTDEERQKLLVEHMQTLHENMMTAKGMMDGRACPMMRGGKGGMGMGGMGMMKGADGEVAGQGMGMDRMQMMEKRMDMMQMKMDAMMKNQSNAATAAPTITPAEKSGTP